MTNPLLDANSCDNLANLRGNDLLELLATVESFLVEYRDNLGLPDNATFGVEIEYEMLPRFLVTGYINHKLPRWNSGYDGTVSTGGEIRSPILSDTKECWMELKKICKYLKRLNAVMNHHAGGHIHVGVQSLGSKTESWRLFVKTYMLYEHVMMRFFYGDKINGRSTLSHYAPPIADRIYENIHEINEARDATDVICELPGGKYGAINFGHIHTYHMDSVSSGSTIELRCPNATSEHIVWQNNINAFAKMLDTCKNRAIDESFLNYQIKKYKTQKGKVYRNEVILKSALEYADLIFDNNLDKMYFLRQYIKDFQPGVEAKEAIHAKSFIK